MGFVRFFELCFHGFEGRFAEKAGDDNGDDAEKESEDNFVNAQMIQACFS